MIPQSPRALAKPEPGFYRVRLIRGGPWVAARISYGPPPDPETGEPLDRSWFWTVEIDGQLYADPSPSWRRAGVDRVWLFGEKITEAEYDYLLAMRHHAVTHEPALPAAQPDKPVDLLRVPTPF